MNYLQMKHAFFGGVKYAQSASPLIFKYFNKLRIYRVTSGQEYFHTCLKIKKTYPYRINVNQIDWVRNTSNSRDDTEHKELEKLFKDDPEMKKLLHDIGKDFNSTSLLSNIDGTANQGIIFEADSYDDSDHTSESSDSEDETDIISPVKTKSLTEGVSWNQQTSSTPKITEKSDYIIVQDDIVYDYEELNDEVVEEEIDVNEVFYPIKLERGNTGVFDIEELVELIDYENGMDICVIEVPNHFNYVDYLLIVTAKSIRHCKAIAETVRICFKKKRKGQDAASVDIEGFHSNDWLAVDLGNIALHIMLQPTREKFDLETLWTVGSDFDDNPQKEETIEHDPFAIYLKDFGMQSLSNDSTSAKTNDSSLKKGASSRTVLSHDPGLKETNSSQTVPKFQGMENVSGWHNSTINVKK